MCLTRRQALAGAALVWAAVLRPAHGSPTTKIVVPLPAGAAGDTVARILANALQQETGQTFVIENRPGASGIIGMGEASRADDSRTLLMAFSSILSGAPHLYKKIPFDPFEFVPISLVGTGVFVLVVRSSLPVTDLHSFIAYLQAHKGLLFGRGNLSGKVLGAQVSFLAGVDFAEIPYEGESKMLTDLAAGRIDWGIAAAGSALGYVTTGAIRPLGSASGRTSLLMPDIPVFQKAGLPKYVSLESWCGLVAPRNFSASKAEELSVVVGTILAQKEVRHAMERIDYAPQSSTPAEFGAYMRVEASKWSTVMSNLHIPKI